MSDRVDALILPGDEPIKDVTLKKHLLFFDSLTLANPADESLINEGDIVEEFPECTLTWAARNSFPRATNYVDDFNLLLEETKHFQDRGLIRLTNKKPSINLDPGMDFSIWHTAVGEKDLVEAAIPDFARNEQPPLQKATYMYGAVIGINGRTSKYSLDGVIPRYTIEGIDERWSIYSHLRLGRFLKFLRKANALGLVPISNDEANSSLLNAVASKTNSLIPNKINYSNEQLATLAFSLDVFEADSLNKVLIDMTWRDVEQLRKITLPGISNLRQHVIKSARKLRTSNLSDIETYTNLITVLNSDYENKKEKVAEEWEKLRIASIAKIGGVVGISSAAEITGLAVTAIINPWEAVLMKVLCGTLVASAAISTELKSLLPAKRAVKQHPLYFTENIIKKF